MAVDIDTLIDQSAVKRRELAAARAELRAAEDHFSTCQLRAEQLLIVKTAGDPKALGSNEEARKRAFATAVAEDLDCSSARQRLRDAQQRVDLLQAELDAFVDQRRLRDLANRERIVQLVETGVDVSLLAHAS